VAGAAVFLRSANAYMVISLIEVTCALACGASERVTTTGKLLVVSSREVLEKMLPKNLVIESNSAIVG